METRAAFGDRAMLFWAGVGTLLCWGCATVSLFPPNVPQGGRAVSIAVSPADPHVMIVASETGGLFTTANGGQTWTHVDGLKNFGVNDVAFAPAVAGPNIVLATAGVGFTATNDGFIWRSTDGGKTWAQPPGSLPTGNTSRCPARANAYGLSFEPNTANVFVATDCGLAVSKDAGATWGPFLPIGPVEQKVDVVLARPGGRLEVSTPSGLWSSPDRGQHWVRAGASAPSYQGGNHVFAASPLNPDHLFMVGGNYQVFASRDPGNQVWLEVSAPGAPSFSSRVPFVRTALANSPGQFDVYYGNGNGAEGGCLFRQRFSEGIAPAAQPGALTSWVSAGDKIEHISYTDTRGHIIELYAPMGQVGWNPYSDDHDQAGAPTAQPGALTSWVSASDNTQHISFIDTRGHIIELYMPVGRPPWRPYADVHDQSGAPTAQPGALTSWVSAGDNTQHISFIDTRGHIIELYMPVGQPPWRPYADVHDQAGAPTAQPGALTSWVSAGDNTQHISFIDTRGHIIELYMPVGQPPWRPYADVHDQTGAPNAQPGALTSWVSASDNTQHISFIDTRGHIIELYVPVGQPPWRPYADVHDQTGAPTAQSGALSSWLTAGDNSQHLSFIDGSGHTIELHVPVGQPPWRPFTDVTVSAGVAVGTGQWTVLNVDHCDPNDVAFDGLGVPVLLASDGGVHTTSDGGASWRLTGSGPGGYNALQLDDVVGQFVSGPSPTCPASWSSPSSGCRLDLYYGSQDNGLRASGDSGVTWPGLLGAEGHSLQTPSVNTPAASDYVVTGDAINGLGLFSSGPLFSNATGWRNPPGGTPQTPAPSYLLCPGCYGQETSDSNGVTTFWVTTNVGASWSSSFTILPAVAGVHPYVSGPAQSPTVYEAVRRAGATPDGLPVVGLVKAQNVLAARNGTTGDADGTPQAPLGSLGSFGTMFSWYWVAAVDPNNPDHLMAADIESNQMRFSADGGQNWFPDATLTSLITNNGAFDFREGPNTLARAIAFDPYDPCDILVGTAQNGIFHSADGANSWTKLAGSEVIPNVTGFYFPPAGPVVVSTWGRSLWTLKLARGGASCSFKAPPSPPPPLPQPLLIDPRAGGATPVSRFDRSLLCPQCAYVIVANGAITDVTTKDDTITGFSVSGGSVHQFDPGNTEVALTIPNTYSPVGTDVSPQLRSLLKAKTPIRGLVIEGHALRGILASQAELPFKPARVPYIRVLTEQSRGIPATRSGGKVTVIGEGYSPSTGQDDAVEIRFGEVIVGRGIAVGADGKFRADFKAQRMPGDYALVVAQKQGMATAQERSYVKVVTSD
jgi:photosystem II stability/assembly factor-like uncharacterized protein